MRSQTVKNFVPAKKRPAAHRPPAGRPEEQSTPESTSQSSSRVPLWNHLFTPVDISFLVLFRIAFGAIMLWEVTRYLPRTWAYYLEPKFLFTFYGFEWVKPWPGNGMYWHFIAMGLFATCIMLGLFYRVAAPLFFLAFTYIFLLDETQYLNHFYLVSLVSFLMIFLPASRAFSLDALLRPALRSETMPAWVLWLLRAQIGIPYFFGGVAKLNYDWLHGEPLRQWLANRSDYAIVGNFFTHEWAAYFFSYGGLFLDLFIVPLLLWRRTRLIAYIVAFTFHLMNNYLFRIGIFPWFMMAGTLVFFDAHWPRVVWAKLRQFFFTLKQGKAQKAQGTAQEKEGETESPKVASAPAASAMSVPAPLLTASAPLVLSGGQKVTVALLGCYMAFQILMPLRHWLYPGDVMWTEEGHRFSWRMKLRGKIGRSVFYATDPVSGTTWRIRPYRHLNLRQAQKMAGQPDMVLQFAHYIADGFRKRGYSHIEVRALVLCKLNGRRAQLLVDPTVDLAAQRRSLLPASWIVPLHEPFRRSDAARKATVRPPSDTPGKAGDKTGDKAGQKSGDSDSLDKAADSLDRSDSSNNSGASGPQGAE